MKDRPKQPPAPAPRPPAPSPRPGNNSSNGRIQGGDERKIDPIYKLPDNPPPPPKK